MWPNRQEPADLVTFTEEIRNGKLHFLCSVRGEACKTSCSFQTLRNTNDVSPFIRNKTIFVFSFCFMQHCQIKCRIKKKVKVAYFKLSKNFVILRQKIFLQGVVEVSNCNLNNILEITELSVSHSDT